MSKTIDGYPVKFVESIPKCAEIVSVPLVPPDRFFDAELPDGTKIKIKFRIRYVMTPTGDNESETAE